MRTIAIIKRVLLEMLRDKRTLALMFFAPLLILTLMYFLFATNSTSKVQVGFNHLDSQMLVLLNNKHLDLHEYPANVQTKKMIRQHKLAAFISEHDHQLTISYQNSDPSQTTLVKKLIQGAVTKQSLKGLTKLTKIQGQIISSDPAMAAILSKKKPSTIPKYQIGNKYLYGSSGSTFFETFLPILMGFFVFFFVFLISGISLLTERTTGTLNRLLATPVKRGEIISGYLIGYGIFAIIQTLIIVFYAIYVLNVTVLGSIWLVVLINIVVALVALSMGIFVSTFASSEFQMIQFIPIVVIPQVFFSGLIPIDNMAVWLQWVAHVMPLYYAGNALTGVIEKDYQFSDISFDLTILGLFALVFIILNIRGMRRYRRV